MRRKELLQGAGRLQSSLPEVKAPDLGVGIGLRVPHYRAIFEQRPAVDFFEIISENFMVPGGKPLYHLDRALESYRLVQHGVSLGIGGPDPPDRDYLERLKRLVKRVEPPWVSDHFCWCGSGGAHLHDLLPLPYTEQTVRIVSERARMLQDFLEVPFALENTSSYLAYTASSMSEWQFVSEIAERADIGLLFDVNNVYVAAYNHGFDAYEFVRSVPHERIVQIHLAGHTNLGKYIIDTHDGPVIDPVWDLYGETIELTGPVSTLVEWDDNIPSLEVVLQEAERARSVRDAALARRTSGRTNRDASARTAPSRNPATAVSSAHKAWTQGGPRETADAEAT
jgi:uncharacterized protein (UPF0276 family)